MIAKVVDKDGREYYSYVFAVSYDGFFSDAIVFDSERDKYQFVNVYKTSGNLTRRVFIVDTSEDNFAEAKLHYGIIGAFHNVHGYDWLVNNRKLFAAIVKGRAVDDEYLEKARQLNGKICIDEWTLVKDDKDVKDLMEAAWDFHDGIITDVHCSYDVSAENPSDRIEVTVDGCWGSIITLVFELNTGMHYSYDAGCYADIMQASVIFDNGYVYFVDDAVYDVTKITCDHNYFRGRVLKWKQTITAEID